MDRWLTCRGSLDLLLEDRRKLRRCSQCRDGGVLNIMLAATAYITRLNYHLEPTRCYGDGRRTMPLAERQQVEDLLWSSSSSPRSRSCF
jgi:hypothetical protein